MLKSPKYKLYFSFNEVKTYRWIRAFQVWKANKSLFKVKNSKNQSDSMFLKLKLAGHR